MSALKPGLYRAAVRGVADQIVMLTDAMTEDPWVSMLTSTGTVRGRWHEGRHITDARPLIVLDLAAPDRFATLLRSFDDMGDTVFTKAADQIEAQTGPARIPEPTGRGAVVTDGSEFHFPWTRFSGSEDQNEGNWINEDGVVHQWDYITDPTLISEGVIES